MFSSKITKEPFGGQILTLTNEAAEKNSQVCQF